MLIDFGGVLTTSLFDAFRAFSWRVSGDPLLLERVLAQDAESAELLAEHECGRLSAEAFEQGFASRLRDHGVDVDGVGLIAGVRSGLRCDDAMLGALRRLRAAGIPVGIVSNSLGDDCYAGYDLDELADVAVISSEVGVRKPGRRIYQIACRRLGMRPADCVMVDDLEHNLRGAARLGIRGVHHIDTRRTLTELGALFDLELAS